MEHAALSRPSLKNSLLEYRVAFDVASLPMRMIKLSTQRSRDIGLRKPVFVIPGFGASDRTMAPFRYFLEKQGYDPLPWGLGVNRAGLDLTYDTTQISWDFETPPEHKAEMGVPRLCDLLSDKVRTFHQQTGQKVRLVGWSLGGYISREVARDCPEIVEQVVTMGSPVIGGPKYTAAAPALARKGLDLNWIERGVAERESRPIKCPVTAIVSPNDGIVDWSASVVPNDTNTRYIRTDVCHLGMGFSEKTMNLVLRELDAH